jgi:hypothetical protein
MLLKSFYEFTIKKTASLIDFDTEMMTLVIYANLSAFKLLIGDK